MGVFTLSQIRIFSSLFIIPKNILFLMIGKIYQNYELTQPNMCIIPEDIPSQYCLLTGFRIFLSYMISGISP